MDNSNKVSHIIYSIIVIAYCILIGLILLDITILGSSDYLYKKDFAHNNIVILIIVVLVIGLGYLLYRYGKIKISKYVIWIASFVLLCAQLFVYYNILFVTHTWDAGTILEDAIHVTQGMYVFSDMEYYSHFPNNVWLFSIISVIIRLCNLVGITGFESQLYTIVVIQSILSTLTGVLVYKAVKDATRSRAYGIVSWVLYVVLIGLSAQGVIVYSDMMSLIFPVLVFRLYQTTQDGDKIYVKWFLIVLLSIVGFKIKPTAVIVLIGIIVVEIIDRIINHKTQKIIGILKIVASVAAAAILGVILSYGVTKSSGITIDKELNTGPLHMLMMGTNDNTNGSFNMTDVMLSEKVRTKDERTKLQLETIKERVSNRGFGGNVSFYINKALMIFNDGTFAIGDEGGYYDEVFPDKIGKVSSALKSWYYSDGELFGVSSMIQHIVWIAIILLNVLACIGIRDKDKYKATLAISLAGIIVFNLLFEARARYLLIYVPLFVIMAICSLDNIYTLVKEKQTNKL